MTRLFSLLVLCGAVFVIGTTGAAASGLTGTTLPFKSGNSFLAVDPVGQHVFVTGGTGYSVIVVLDFNGTIVQTISSEPGASGMAVNTASHTLFVALADAGQVATIDTTTLTETGRLSAGTDTTPYEIAIAAGKLWVTGSGAVSMNLDGTGISTGLGGPLIAASPDGNLLATADMGFSPARVSVYDVATKTPTLIASPWYPDSSSNGQDISFDATGANVLYASGAPYYTHLLSTLTLQPSGKYLSTAYPNSVAQSPGGAYVAGGSWQPYNPDVYVFRTGQQSAIASWSIGSGSYGPDFLWEHALAFSPDGTKLFAVADSQLFVLPNPGAADTPVSVTSWPAAVTVNPNASFDFSSPDNSVTFKCSLDDAPAIACTSPATYGPLASGLHTFAVEAFSGGAVGGSTGRTWMVQALDTALTGGPGTSTTYATTATFSFSSHDDAATFQCSLDNADWAPCTSPVSLTQLGTGSHTFKVRPVDGPVVGTGQSAIWTVLAPDTHLTGSPSDPTYSNAPSFSFFSHASGGTFQCSLDNADWATCSSPATYSGLGYGTHTFSVRAINDTGVMDPVGATKTWTIVKVSNITTQITQAPGATGRSTSATFAFKSNDPFASFVCSIDGAPLADCSSPATFTGLAEGPHTFSVFAFDGDAGDATGASKSWTIDVSTPPVAALLAPSPVASTTQVTLDASGSHDSGDGSIVDYQWDLGSGSFTVDSGSTPTTSTTYDTPGVQHVRVKVTDALGLTAIATATINVALAPPPGYVGISINNGDYATNSPNVQLNVIWPLFASTALISNDGGFGVNGGTQTVPVAATIPWAIPTGGSERLPHTVYVRFPDSSSPLVTFTDDIILDTTSPVVSAAAPAGTAAGAYKVKLVATEKLSGISQAQFSTTKSDGTTVVLAPRTSPGLTTVKKTVAVSMAAAPKWARVRSAAGVWSAWHKVKR